MAPIKIYPSKHKIEIINESTFDTDLNIPLAYVNLDYAKYDIVKTIEKDFLKSDAGKNISMTPILPNQLIEDPNRYVFNKFEERTSIEKLCNTVRGKTYFVPPYEYIPFQFSYNVTVKKNMTYNTSNKYKINVACCDDSDSLDLSTRLAQIFINPADRGLITKNIEFNNNKLDSNAMIDISFDEADFLFLETYDGEYLTSEMKEDERVNISNFLDSNTNVWVGCDTHHYYKYRNDDLGYMTFTNIGAYKEFELKRSLLSTNTKIMSDVYFNLNRSEYLNQPGKNLYNLFTNELSPVLIIEHIGKGFEIISHNDVLKDPVKNKDLIYEVMMFVYLMSYKKSNRIDEWISYSVPDYEVVNNRLCSKTNFSSSVPLSEIFDMNYSDYNIYQVDIYDNNSELPMPDNDLVNAGAVDFIDVSNNRLVFTMPKTSNSIYTEVEKPLGWVSVYKDGKIYIMDQIYYYIESDITNKLFTIEEDNSLVVKLYPFKSSKYNLNITTDLSLTITNIKTDVNGVTRIINEIYIIYYDTNTEKIEYALDSEYKDLPNHIKILEIDIHQSIDNTFLTDMRQLGGGLIKEAPNDYDLLDIGHMDGRPYRQANTLIITMPKKYEEYKDKILSALEKYKVGEDYVILFFEDDKE